MDWGGCGGLRQARLGTHRKAPNPWGSFFGCSCIRREHCIQFGVGAPTLHPNPRDSSVSTGTPLISLSLSLIVCNMAAGALTSEVIKAAITADPVLCITPTFSNSHFTDEEVVV